MLGFEFATYHESALARYRNNPLNEAIYPILTMSKEKLYKAIAYRPEYDPSERFLPTELRLAAVQAAVEFFQPLPKHWDLATRLFRGIGQGNNFRNPCEIGYYESIETKVRTFINDFKERENKRPKPRTTVLGFNALGITGSGKSTAFQMILDLFPPAIIHQKYKGRVFTPTQVPALYVQCPPDGSLRGLFFGFFSAVDSILGTDYYGIFARNGKATVDEMLIPFARVILFHHMGILVIDDVDRLMDFPLNAPRIFNAVSATINSVKMPVVLIGTYKALPLFSKELSLVRRGAGQGDMIWEPLPFDSSWRLLMNEAWRYDYTLGGTPLTDELSLKFHKESRGILAFALTMRMMCQVRAMQLGGDEKITEALVSTVALEDFRMARPLFNALDKKDYGALASLSDVRPPDLQLYIEDTLRVLAEGRKQNDAVPASPTTSHAPEQPDGKQNAATADENPKKDVRPKSQSKTRSSKPEPLANGFLAGIDPAEKDAEVVYRAMKGAGHIASPAMFMDADEAGRYISSLDAASAEKAAF